MGEPKNRATYISDLVAKTATYRATKNRFWLQPVYIILSIFWFCVVVIGSFAFWMAVYIGGLNVIDRRSSDSFALLIGDISILPILFATAGVALALWSFPVVMTSSKTFSEAAFLGNWDRNFLKPLTDGHLRHYARRLIENGNVIVGQDLSVPNFIRMARRLNHTVSFRWIAILWIGTILVVLLDVSQTISDHPLSLITSEVPSR